MDIEQEGDGAFHIHADAPIIAYLQAYETPKECDWVVHKAKSFKWEGNSFLHVWVDGQVWVVPHPKQCENLVKHVHKELGHFGVQ